MNKEKVDIVVSKLNDLEYDDKNSCYSRIFSLGNFNSTELNEKLVLISLVTLVYQQMRIKDSDITPLKVLLKITGETKSNSGYYQMLENLSILITDLSYGCTKIDNCGLKTSQEIINRIKEILNTWMPF